MSDAEANLKRLGLELPVPAAPQANYVPFVRAGDLLIISGQIPAGPDGTVAAEHLGKLGGTVGEAAGRAAARVCALNVLAQAKAALGDLGRIAGCVRLGGFINVEPDFKNASAVMNGASDLIVEVLGEAGRHARTTIGVASLPLGCAVEVEAMFRVAG